MLLGLLVLKDVLLLLVLQQVNVVKVVAMHSLVLEQDSIMHQEILIHFLALMQLVLLPLVQIMLLLVRQFNLFH